MDYALTISSTFLPFHKSNHNLHLPTASFSFSSKTLLKPSSRIFISAKTSSNCNINPSNESNKENPLAQTLLKVARTVVLTVVATLITSKLKEMLVKAEPLTSTMEESTMEEEKVENFSEIETGSGEISPLSPLMESNYEFVDNV